MKLSAIITLTLCSSSTNAFSSSTARKTQTALNAKQENVAASAIAAAFILSSTAMFTADISDANAMDYNNFDMNNGSSITLAARSGGRAGGRSSARSARSPAQTRRSTTVNNYNSYSRPAAVGGGYVAPRVIVAPSMGYGYSPFGGIGGFGTGYALGAMGNNNGGNNAREYQEQRDLAQAKAELEVEKEKQAALEARVRAIEAAAGGSNNANVVQQQQIAK